jgi:hypothetical protein
MSKLTDIIFDYRLNVSEAQESQGGDGDLDAIARAGNQAKQQIKDLMLELINDYQFDINRLRDEIKEL